MVRKSPELEVRGDSGVLHAFQDTKTWKLEPAGNTKLQSVCLDVSMKMWPASPEAAMAGALPISCEDTVQRKVTGEITAETVGLLSASTEVLCPEPLQTERLRSEVVDSEGVPDVGGFEYHILAVDDSIVDQRVIEKLLKTSAFKVTTVDSALRALEVLGIAKTCPDSMKKIDVNLIMTDYCMPEMTGYDLLKQVKAHTSALREIPVVVMSSENDSNRIKSCLAEGAEEFIIKPVQMADVKRLRGHIRPPSRTSSSGSGDCTSSPTCGKRKVASPDPLQVTSPERRPWLSGVIAA